MFEHLDDPNPPLPSEAQRHTVVQRAHHRRHRRRRRITGSVVGIVAVGALGAAGLVTYDAHRLGGVRKVQVATRPATDPNVETLLIVGSDLGVYPPAGTNVGADSIVLVRLDRATHRAVTLAVPRDLAVTDPVSGKRVPLRSVLRHHGQGALLTVVQQTLGISVQHYLQLDPAGFVDLVDAVGGASVRSALPLRDSRFPGPPYGGDGLSLPGGTCTTLDGSQALQLARARLVQVRENGRWVPDPSGDLGRMERGSILGRALLASLRPVNFDNPATLHHLIGILADHALVDPGLDATALADLAHAVHALPAGSVTSAWLPLTFAPRVPRGPDMLALGAGWQQVVTAFKDGNATGVAPTAAWSGKPAPAAVAPEIALC